MHLVAGDLGSARVAGDGGVHVELHEDVLQGLHDGVIGLGARGVRGAGLQQVLGGQPVGGTVRQGHGVHGGVELLAQVRAVLGHDGGRLGGRLGRGGRAHGLLDGGVGGGTTTSGGLPGAHGRRGGGGRDPPRGVGGAGGPRGRHDRGDGVAGGPAQDGGGLQGRPGLDPPAQAVAASAGLLGVRLQGGAEGLVTVVGVQQAGGLVVLVLAGAARQARAQAPQGTGGQALGGLTGVVGLGAPGGGDLQQVGDGLAGDHQRGEGNEQDEQDHGAHGVEQGGQGVAHHPPQEPAGPLQDAYPLADRGVAHADLDHAGDPGEQAQAAHGDTGVDGTELARAQHGHAQGDEQQRDHQPQDPHRSGGDVVQQTPGQAGDPEPLAQAHDDPQGDEQEGPAGAPVPRRGSGLGGRGPLGGARLSGGARGGATRPAGAGTTGGRRGRARTDHDALTLSARPGKPPQPRRHVTSMRSWWTSRAGPYPEPGPVARPPRVLRLARGGSAPRTRAPQCGHHADLGPGTHQWASPCGTVTGRPAAPGPGLTAGAQRSGRRQCPCAWESGPVRSGPRPGRRRRWRAGPRRPRPGRP